MSPRIPNATDKFKVEFLVYGMKYLYSTQFIMNFCLLNSLCSAPQRTLRSTIRTTLTEIFNYGTAAIFFSPTSSTYIWCHATQELLKLKRGLLQNEDRCRA